MTPIVALALSSCVLSRRIEILGLVNTDAFSLMNAYTRTYMDVTNTRMLISAVRRARMAVQCKREEKARRAEAEKL